MLYYSIINSNSGQDYYNTQNGRRNRFALRVRVRNISKIVKGGVDREAILYAVWTTSEWRKKDIFSPVYNYNSWTYIFADFHLIKKSPHD